MSELPDQHVRDLLHQAAPPSDGVDRDALAPRLAPRRRLPGRPAGWVVGATAVAVAAAVVVAVALNRDRSSGPPPPASYSPTDYAALVVHDGDRVRMSGHVVAIAGDQPRICVTGFTYGPAYQDRETVRPCSPGVALRGLDVDELSMRHVVGDDVEGMATVEGTYRGGTITISKQTATKTRIGLPNDRVPCAEPSGGWPEYKIRSIHAVTRYSHAHPHAVAKLALLRPSPGHEVMYVATGGDPGPVTAALRPTYGTSLCVVRALSSAPQRQAAIDAFEPIMATDQISSVGGDTDDHGQPTVSVDLFRVTPRIAALAAAQQPRGLVQLNPALYPLR